MWSNFEKCSKVNMNSYAKHMHWNHIEKKVTIRNEQLTKTVLYYEYNNTILWF